MSPEIPTGEQQQPPPPQGLGRWVRSISGGAKGLAAAITTVSVIFGAFYIGYDKWKERQARTPEAEYGRLAKLKAGIPLSRFQASLEQEEADVETPGSGGLKRHIYARPYDYVLAVTDENQTVISFSVMVRKPDFHPRFDDIVLGQTTLASAVETPEALAGVCGRPVAYFERTGLSTATPIAIAVGITASGHADDKDLELVCNADRQLDRCGGYADLTEKAVDCFLNTAEGKQLRENLRPNIYAEGAPYQDLSDELLTVFEPEIMAAEG